MHVRMYVYLDCICTVISQVMATSADSFLFASKPLPTVGCQLNYISNHAVCYVNLSINCIVCYCFKCRLLRVLLSVEGGVPVKWVCLCVRPQLVCSNACGWVAKTYGRGTHVQAAHACNASCCGWQSRSNIAYCRKNESHKV